MTEQTKSEKKQVSHKKKSNFFRNSVFIITVLFIAGIFLVKQIRPDLIEKIYPQAGSSGDTNVSQEFTPDSDLVKEALQEVYSFGPEPPLLSFSPEEEESEEEPTAETEEEAGKEAPVGGTTYSMSHKPR